MPDRPETKLGSTPEPGDVIAGRFVVDEVLGTGAMGVVVAARSITLRRRVAVKLVRCGVDGYARFEREAVALAALESDHVVRVLEYGTADDGAPYLVMEYLVGRDLRDELAARGGRLPIDESVDCALEACVGLRAAHALGIVHRDIKPGNLFLAERAARAERAEREGEPRRVKVLDFGISKFLASGDPEASGPQSAVIGSPSYMSPEQIRLAGSVDQRADIWSLGVVLHRMITGRLPFVGEGFSAICAAVATEAPPPLRRDCPEAPAALERVVLRCLEKDPARRFGDVEELASALAPFASARGRLAEAKLTGPGRAEPMFTSIAPTSRPIPAPPGGSERPSDLTRAEVLASRRHVARRRTAVAASALAAALTAAAVAVLARPAGRAPSADASARDLAVSAGPAPVREIVPAAAPPIAPSASAPAAQFASASSAIASIPPRPRAAPPPPRRPAPSLSASSSAAPVDWP